MSNVSKINGYDIKDKTARENIDTLRTDLTDLISEETSNRTNGDSNLQTQITNLSSDHATEIINRTNGDSNLQTQINSLASGSPKGVYDTVTALTTADPNHAYTYVVLADGKWYYYDTTDEEWKAGGDYQSTLPQYLTRDYLSDYYNSKQMITEAVDLNSIKEEGMYLIATTTGNNNPFRTTGLLIVQSNAIEGSNIWVEQVFMNTDSNKVARRTLRFNNNGAFHSAQAWQYITYNDILSNNNIDFNSLIDEGIYLNTTNQNQNIPFNNSGILKVDRIYKSSDSNKWILQKYYHIDLDKIAYRILRVNPVTNEIVTSTNWKIINFDSSIELNNKTIVNFGDSIFGNTQGANSISNTIADITHATVYNVGFGGCQMSDRTGTTWKAFSMCNLADSIANNNYSLQDTAVNDSSWTDKPWYFDSSLTLLKSIDFSTVDYITIAYGTNDYTAGVMLDDENNKYNKNTFAGALRYSIETLLTAYPNLKILLGTPIYRLWLNNGVYDTDSDIRTYTGGYTLIEMTEKVIEIAKEYHIPVLDAYNNLGLNKFNWTSYFTAPDTTHPNPTGNKKLGRLYGMKLLNI